MKEQGLVECSCDAWLAALRHYLLACGYELRHSPSWEENLMAGLPRLIEPDPGKRGEP
jgi:hypothetical protein